MIEQTLGRGIGARRNAGTMDDKEFTYLTSRIRKHLDIDLEAYKPEQMRRRLTGFVEREERGGVSRFCRRLQREPDLRTALRDTITINVSEFFRDAAPWPKLRSKLLPELLETRQTLRIWSAGCSNGQEPYTVAMILADLQAGSRAQILATDLDRVTLARAKAGGPYRPDDVRNVPPALRTKHLREAEDGFYVADLLRKRVRFRELNLLSDAFDRDFDLVICRNVLIYFSNEAKLQLLRRFCDSLRPGGVLLVGGTEAILSPESLGLERLGGTFYRNAPSPQQAAA